MQYSSEVNTLTNFQEGEEKMALKLETVKDPELSALHKLISEGWPPKRSSVPDNLKDYWNYRDEVTVEDGILLKNWKFIVPKNLSVSLLVNMAYHSLSGQTMVPAMPHKNSRHSSKTYKSHIVPALHTALNPMVWQKVDLW